MAVVVDSSVFADVDGSGLSNERIIVVTSDEAATDALRRAALRFSKVGEDGIEYETGDVGPSTGTSTDDIYTPNYVSVVNLSDRGPWMYVDCKGQIPDPMRDRFVAIVLEELQAADISHARVETPSAEDMYGGPLRDLKTVLRAVTLHLYPPPPPTRLPLKRADRVQLPLGWLEAAGQWLQGDMEPDVSAMVQFRLWASEYQPLAGALQRFVADRHGIIVLGDLGKTVRGVHATTGVPGYEPSLALAAGGPGATDDEQLRSLAALIEFARSFAGEVAYAFAAVEVDFGPFAHPQYIPDWAVEGDGASPMSHSRMEMLLDEIVLDGFPYQILGPGHLRHLGGMPAGARALQQGRFEVSVGNPEDWLLEQSAYARTSHPERYMLSELRRNPAVQAEARTVLRNCLVNVDETRSLLRERRAKEEG